MKSTNPSKWYQLAKRLGTDDHKNDDLKVECLNNVPLNEAAEGVPSTCSDTNPSYLPAQNTLKVSQVEVADRLWKMKSKKNLHNL